MCALHYGGSQHVNQLDNIVENQEGDKMEYKVINLNDGPYLLPIPNMATERQMPWYDKIILELHEKIAAHSTKTTIQQMPCSCKTTVTISPRVDISECDNCGAQWISE